MLAKLQGLLPANRLVALVTILGGLAALATGLAQVLPGTWPNYALAAAGLLTKAVTAVKFLDGSQKWDALTAPLTMDGDGPGDPDSLPTVASADPASITPDQGDAGTAQAA